MTSVNGDHSRTQVWDTFGEALQLFDRKNADYGDAWRSNGWRGNLSRIFEKAQRVRNLAWRNDPRTPAMGDEQVIETLIDMLNTTAFAIINLRDGVEWGHEVPRSVQALRYQEEKLRQHADPTLMGAAEATSTELFRPVLEPTDGAALVATTVTDTEDNGPTAVPGGRRRQPKPGPQQG